MRTGRSDRGESTDGWAGMCQQRAFEGNVGHVVVNRALYRAPVVGCLVGASSSRAPEHHQQTRLFRLGPR
jgi:hypothetical protein